MWKEFFEALGPFYLRLTFGFIIDVLILFCFTEYMYSIPAYRAGILGICLGMLAVVYAVIGSSFLE